MIGGYLQWVMQGIFAMTELVKVIGNSLLVASLSKSQGLTICRYLTELSNGMSLVILAHC